MKKVIVLLVALFIIVGCGSKKQEEKVTKVESFSDEYYVNFPKVKSIVNYLNKSSSDITVLEEEKDRLVFCLMVDDTIDMHDETIISYANYVRLLEKEGYTMSLLDATISSTFVLEKDKYKVSITILSNIEEWKKEQKDLDTSKIKDQNLVYQVTLK